MILKICRYERGILGVDESKTDSKFTSALLREIVRVDLRAFFPHYSVRIWEVVMNWG